MCPKTGLWTSNAVINQSPTDSDGYHLSIPGLPLGCTFLLLPGLFSIPVIGNIGVTKGRGLEGISTRRAHGVRHSGGRTKNRPI